jgi:hypothetical protein
MPVVAPEQVTNACVAPTAFTGACPWALTAEDVDNAAAVQRHQRLVRSGERVKHLHWQIRSRSTHRFAKKMYLKVTMAADRHPTCAAASIFTCKIYI